MKKRAIESRVEQVYQIRPEHLNGAGRLFGGRLMEWIDEVAGLVGIRHSQCNVITASVDNLKFIRGVFQNDLVVLVGTLTWVGWIDLSAGLWQGIGMIAAQLAAAFLIWFFFLLHYRREAKEMNERIQEMKKGKD